MPVPTPPLNGQPVALLENVLLIRTILPCQQRVKTLLVPFASMICVYFTLPVIDFCS